jgi:hypothetical protein
MPWIDERGRRMPVSEADAALLIREGLVYPCSDCEEMHHEDYERWEEIEDLLAARRAFFKEGRDDKRSSD